VAAVGRGVSSAQVPPTVSVVIPTFRHEGVIEETLNSVFAQTFRDFEVIVVNDGSPDGPAERLQPWIEAGKIRYHEQANAGQSAARNAGLQLARGEFIALLDDDDLWPADKLEWQVERLGSQPHVAVTYGFARGFGNNQAFRNPEKAGDSGQLKDVLLRRNVIMSPGQALVRARDLAAIGGFDEAIRGADDWDLWLRLADRGAYDYVDRCALHYRVHAKNASGDSRYMFRALIGVLHKHLGYTPLSRRGVAWLQCRRFVGRLTATPELNRARDARRRGQRSEAYRHLARAVRYDPPLIGSPRLWHIVLKG
jgi:glycosyltransferase involved in cell wall biosynthesis